MGSVETRNLISKTPKKSLDSCIGFLHIIMLSTTK
jgi:hypothetical protein